MYVLQTYFMADPLYIQLALFLDFVRYYSE
jgi:hypothetical protein